MKNIVQQSRHHLATFLFSLLSILFIMAACDEPSKPNNGGGGGTTADTTLAAPVINVQPTSQAITEGSTTTLSVTATAAAGTTLSYQWQSAAKGSTAFTDITGATSVSYKTPMLRSDQSGIQYRVIVTATNTFNRKNTATSNAATISVTLDPTRITITKSIAGMREFVARVDFSGIAADGKDSLEFVVSGSATPPDYEKEVKNNISKRKRVFKGADASREVYFCFTKDLLLFTHDGQEAIQKTQANLIDLRGLNKAGIKAKMAEENPGFMIPGETYYVHVYHQGTFVKSSTGISLHDYPATVTAPITNDDLDNDPTNGDAPKDINRNPQVYTTAVHLVGMDEWRTDTTLKSIEINTSEINVVFYRMAQIADNTTCGKTPVFSIGIIYSSGNQTAFSFVLTDSPTALTSVKFGLRFKTPSVMNNVVMDVMSPILRSSETRNLFPSFYSCPPLNLLTDDMRNATKQPIHIITE